MPKVNIGLDITASPVSALYGSAATYVVGGFIPGLITDFEAEYYRTKTGIKSFSDTITHTRASTATYVDSNGVLQTADVNVPRVGHHVWNGSAWGNEGLLGESEARTNLLTYSSEFDNAAWVKSDFGGVTANQATAPDGTTSADLVNLSGSTTARVVQAASISAESTLSVWVKSVSGSGTFPFSYFDAGASGDYVNINVAVTDRWERKDITVPSNATAFGFSRRGDQDTATLNQCYVWGAQLEAGATPSSYIPTNSGDTVTRAADVLTIPAANLPWNPLAVSIQMDGRVTYADTDQFAEVYFWRWFNDVSNQTYANLRTNQSVNGGRINFWQTDAGVADSVVSADVYTPGVLVPYNIASRHGSTFINGAVDGTALTANTTPTALPDLSATDLQLAFDYMGTVRTFRVWADDLTDAGIVDATEPSLEPSLSLIFDGTENSFTVDDWSE